MKQRIILSIYTLLFLFVGKVSADPIVNLGIFNSPVNSNRLEIRTQTTQDVTAYLSGMVFTIRHPISYNVNLTINGGPPYFFSTTVTKTTYDNYRYYSFQFSHDPEEVTWLAGVSVPAAVINIINEGGSGNGIFELVTGDPGVIANNGNLYVELNGTNMGLGFYQFSTAAPLPVELLSFNAKALPNGSVDLDWESAFEKQMAYYEVEHSMDGQQFTALGKESAKGGENVTAQYRYNHKTPQAGTNYYRLRMVGLDGEFRYSHLRNVILEREDADFSLLPTPTSGPLALTSRRLDKYVDGLLYQLTDNTGRLIRMDKITTDRTQFDLSNEPSGAYYLNILSERERIAQFPILVTKQ